MKVGAGINGITYANVNVTQSDFNHMVVPMLVIVPSAVFWFCSAAIIYKKVSRANKSDEGSPTTSTPGGDTTDETHKPSYENYNSAIYEHKDDKFDWLVGNVIYYGGIHLFAGQKSCGKSLLITQMMDCVSKGMPFELFVQDKENPCYQKPMPVYLTDLEMQYSQLSQRNGKHCYQFDYIYRDKCQSYSTYSWLENFRITVESLTGDALFVVDNISRFTDYVQISKTGKDLYDGIKKIRDKAMEKGIRITVILVAHVTNDRLDSKPITMKDLALADTLTTGVDTVFVIGPTRWKNKKLLKILASRNGAAPDYVELLKHRDEPFASFDLEGHVEEDSVLPGVKEFKEPGESEPSNASYDEIFARYVEVARMKAELDADPKRKRQVWTIIKKEKGVSNQLFNGWKKKYGKLKFNEVGDVIQETSEEKES